MRGRLERPKPSAGFGRCRPTAVGDLFDVERHCGHEGARTHPIPGPEGPRRQMSPCIARPRDRPAARHASERQLIRSPHTARSEAVGHRLGGGADSRHRRDSPSELSQTIAGVSVCHGEHSRRDNHESRAPMAEVPDPRRRHRCAAPSGSERRPMRAADIVWMID